MIPVYTPAFVTEAIPALVTYSLFVAMFTIATPRPIQHQRLYGVHTLTRSLKHRFDVYYSSSQYLYVFVSADYMHF